MKINPYRILAIGLIVLGMIHCVMVTVNFSSLASEAIFSMGTGIGVMFLGLLNYAASKLLAPILFSMAIIANIVQVIYSISSLLVFNDMPSYIGFLIFSLVLIFSLLEKRKKINTLNI